MLPNTTKYFLKRDDGGFGKPIALARIHKDQKGLWGEYFKDGQWIESHSAMIFMFNIDFADEIDEETYLSALDYLMNKSKNLGK